ncbi:hypothetical protein VIN30_02795 [Adlercreutzia sp. R7]|uniref:DUF559 domain-containing protein n=1 Tax=Adlercreutzia wanghongyangiae TaxID=3111451 RepID=A0ABU6IG06_9ACTN|nr:hypothetical protein [Adlercreutzia sp. R7]
MNIYLSHLTALRFWRAWSILRPLSLREFHGMGKVASADLFPSSLYQTSMVLRDCAITDRDVCGTLDLLPKMPELRFCLRDCTDEFDAQPWHILHDDKAGVKSTALIARHRSRLDFPRGSFVRLAEGLFICAPELVFVQMASSLSFGELLALGYEMCGCYPRMTQKDVPLVRRPLTTPNRLIAYTTRLRGARGAKLARTVAKQVRAKSGSVMETELAAVAFTSECYGGLGIAEALINAPVALSERARQITRSSWVVLDFYWPDAHFGIEYNGRDSHASAEQQDRDSRKRDGLMVDGIETITLTNSQFQDTKECTKLLDRTSYRAGKRRRKRSEAHASVHRKLRYQVGKFHRRHFPH